MDRRVIKSSSLSCTGHSGGPVCFVSRSRQLLPVLLVQNLTVQLVQNLTVQLVQNLTVLLVQNPTSLLRSTFLASFNGVMYQTL